MARLIDWLKTHPQEAEIHIDFQRLWQSQEPSFATLIFNFC